MALSSATAHLSGHRAAIEEALDGPAGGPSSALVDAVRAGFSSLGVFAGLALASAPTLTSGAWGVGLDVAGLERLYTRLVDPPVASALAGGISKCATALSAALEDASAAEDGQNLLLGDHIRCALGTWQCPLNSSDEYPAVS